MADQAENSNGHDEERRRRPAAGGVSLAEEGGEEGPAALGLAVGIAVVVAFVVGGALGLTPGGGATAADGDSALVADGATDDGATDDASTDGADDEAGAEADEAEADEADEAGADDGADEPAASVDEAALTGLAGAWPGLAFANDGGVLTVTGTVPDEAAKTALLAEAAAVPGVTEVVDEVEVVPAAVPAVDVSASQARITLAGTVPSRELADELVARAAAIYSPDQVDDQLVIDPEVGTPVAISVTGSTTDEVLHRSLLGAFDGIAGVDPVETGSFVLEESAELESSLNTLEPIEFASGSARILPDSEPILDQAAQFLNDNPDVSLEIGGHTDSIGEPEGNQRLSQARADAVLAALQGRGVTNDLVARGFGETRLKVDPDDTPEKQQENRRIEFRILG